MVKLGVLVSEPDGPEPTMAEPEMVNFENPVADDFRDND